MASNLSESSQKTIPEFDIGEIVKARDRLWRIDQFHKVEKEIKEIKDDFLYEQIISDKNFYGALRNSLV